MSKAKGELVPVPPHRAPAEDAANGLRAALSNPCKAEAGSERIGQQPNAKGEQPVRPLLIIVPALGVR